jgi:hypothetical protein
MHAQSCTGPATPVSTRCRRSAEETLSSFTSIISTKHSVVVIAKPSFHCVAITLLLANGSLHGASAGRVCDIAALSIRLNPLLAGRTLAYDRILSSVLNFPAFNNLPSCPSAFLHPLATPFPQTFAPASGVTPPSSSHHSESPHHREPRLASVPSAYRCVTVTSRGVARCMPTDLFSQTSLRRKDV